MRFWTFVTITGTLILALVEFYFIKRFKWILKLIFPKINLKKFKAVKIIFLIVLNLYPAFLIISFLCGLFSEGRMSPPEASFFDYTLVYPFWILFLFMFQSGIYFLVIDVLRLIFYPLYKSKKEKINSYAAKFMFAIMIFFAVYVPVRIVYDYKNVSVRIVEYKKESLPKELNGFKIILISDIQADKYTDENRLQNFIDKVNSTKPDLVLIAGDFITSSPDYIRESADYVAKIKSKYGIYACVGDHDNWAYRDDYARSLREVSEALKEKGIDFIDNSKREILVDSSKICITFITNTYVEQVDNKTLDRLTMNDKNCDLKIFLVHQPRQFLVDKAVERNYDLFLAGHTHGGQITLMFPFFYITPTMFETSFIRGDFHFEDMLMIVTRGLGMSLAPIRYNSTPEVTVIVLKNK